MFTGIIQEIGSIKKIEILRQKRWITIACHSLQSDLQIGESIACNGICLTVVHFNAESITAEIMDQTLKITTAQDWHQNTSIHLEKALALSSRLNGHLVQGHIDTTLPLTNRFTQQGTLYLQFPLPAQFQHLVVEHGSVCLDGVSLTVANLQPTSFQVALIKHTLEMTHFKTLKINELVNVEFDLIGKYVTRMMQLKQPKVTETWLAENGF